MAIKSKSSKPVEGEIVNEVPNKSKKSNSNFLSFNGNSVIMNIGIFLLWVSVSWNTFVVFYGTEDVVSRIMLIPMVGFVVSVIFYKFFK